MLVAELSSTFSKVPGPQEAGLLRVPKVASALLNEAFF